MVNFFDNLYSSIPPNDRINKSVIKSKIHSFLRFLIRSCANILIPLYYGATSNKNKYNLNKNCGNIDLDKKIIVTLTSFPLRINRVWLVIESLLRQKDQPDEIIIWLSKDQFAGFECLPNNLKKQSKRGLKIKFVDGDIRSHKKYYYTIKEFPEDLIITVDDDILYRNDFIRSMLEYHKENPRDIISFYSKVILRQENKLITYNKWPKSKVNKRSISEIFFGSGGGTLFPPHSLYKDVLNKELFLDLTPLADDVWLNAMSRLNRTYIYSVSNKFHIPLPVINKNNKTLAENNVYENLNDIQINKVRDYYLKNLNVDPFEVIKS